VLNSENKVSKHLVKPGIQDSQKVVIAAGLSAGDRVVTDGIDRLTEGAKVEVVDAQNALPMEATRGGRKGAVLMVLPPGEHRRPVAPVHYASCRHHAADGGDFARRDHRLPLPPVSALPEVDYPTIQVVTLYPGASPDGDVCDYRPAGTPVWPDVGLADVIAKLRRRIGRDAPVPADAAAGCRRAGSAGRHQRRHQPAALDLPNPPVYSKVNPADPPIMTLAVTSSAMPMTQVEDMVETRVAQKISQVSGVGLVTLAGGQRPAVRVKLNAQAIAALG
jgi:hypothetical protein